MEKVRLSPHQKLQAKLGIFLEKSQGQRQKKEGMEEDIIGPYPQNVHVTSLEGRRALWTARAFAIGMFISLMLNVTLVMAIAALMPLKRVEPMLLKVNEKTSQIVQVEPFQKSVQGFDLMVEQYVRDYVLNRESITMHPREMEFRWGERGYIYNRTTPEAYLVFNKQLPEYRKAFENGMLRDITIKSVSKIGPNYWTVEYVTKDIDTATNAETAQRTWQATMMVDFLPKVVSFDDRFMNPLGFTVTKYTVVVKG